MTRILTLALALGAAPFAAQAMPALGDILGTNPADASAALEKAGCPVSEFEAEDGKIEAKCIETATSKHWEVYIDPKTGAVVKISED